ncbi:MAG: ABC transporter permease [Desulfobacterales bacterium]|nr:ABC transporter permease [Desulfobacteraceae bacterium]MBT7086575.1 ABC transporter permease [Desulfobacterales bacterium]MBT7695846.1 ABC transporter permease [Desulfobacterales bacterium]
MNIFKMAWRNVWRNKRRTIVTIAAMTVALLAMIVYSSLIEGYMLSMERLILDLEIGDMQIYAKDYRDNPSIYTKIRSHNTLVKQLTKLGYHASPRLLGGGLAASGEASSGVTFRGLEIYQDEKVSHIYKHVFKGKWLDPDFPEEVVIGRRLAIVLGVKPGDELVALSQASDGSMANNIFYVRGVLKNISDATDRSGIFMTSSAFRDFFVFPEGVHQIVLRKDPETELKDAANIVKNIAPHLDVKTWKELMPTLASMVESVRGLMLTVFFIVYIAVAILILNAMLMAVFERIREIGVLKALGFGPGQVMGLILSESAIQTCLSILLGIILSIPSLYYLSNSGINMGTLGGMSIMGLAVDPVWRGVVNANTFISPVLILVLIVFFAVLYPAFKATWIRPVEAIRHQ